MTRKNIFEILASEYSIQKEFKRITQLFDSPTIINAAATSNPSVKIEDLFDRIISRWKQRGPYTSCKEIRNILWQKVSNKRNPSVDDIVMMLEYYSNIIPVLWTKCLGNSSFNMMASDSFFMLTGNMELLLEHLNHERCPFEEDEKVLLIPKNPAATAVAEISSKETALAILKYHHASLKGQLEEKKDLLRRIAKEYEPLLDKGVSGFSDYFTRANGLLNNLDIRHNNTEGKRKHNFIANMPRKELEKWYDELYQLLLFCVLIKDNKDRKDRMEHFFKELRETK